MNLPPNLSTQRLTLRLAKESDAEAIINFFYENRENFARAYPPTPQDFYTAAYWRHHIDQAQQEFEREQTLKLLIINNDGRLVGRISFTQMSRGPFQACYLGYVLDAKHEGQGLMTEALRAAIAYVFEDLNFHRIMANHMPENIRSARVLERLGFVVEGRAKNYLFIDGKWRDHVLNSLVNHGWRNTY